MRLLGKALTFDDVLLVPAFSQVLPKDALLSTQFSRNIRLNLPLVSAAMDTVTEARLAIAIAQEGGIGIVHKNLTPKQQAAEVARVKRYESGLLRDPITVAGVRLDVQASMGIAVSPEHGTDLSQLMARADVAMYAAKDAGRNCVRSVPAQPRRSGEVRPVTSTAARSPPSDCVTKTAARCGTAALSEQQKESPTFSAVAR